MRIYEYVMTRMRSLTFINLSLNALSDRGDFRIQHDSSDVEGAVSERPYVISSYHRISLCRLGKKKNHVENEK